MNKQEVIEFLEKKRERALENIEYFANRSKNQEAMNRVRVDVYTTAIQAILEMDEPKQDKPVVSEEEARMIESGKQRELSVYAFLNSIQPTNAPTDDRLANAYINGYTIKPKRWVVKKGKDCVLTSFTFFDEQSVNYYSNSYGKDYLIFTDKTKAEAVATLVEGTVEEV